jgi:hypothetical protein
MQEATNYCWTSCQEHQFSITRNLDDCGMHNGTSDKYLGSSKEIIMEP